jgi:hypothetical protein
MTSYKTAPARRPPFAETARGESSPGALKNHLPQHKGNPVTTAQEGSVPLLPKVFQEHPSLRVIFHDPLTNATGIGAQERRTRKPEKDFPVGSRRKTKRSLMSRAKAIDAVSRDLAILALKGTRPSVRHQ